MTNADDVMPLLACLKVAILDDIHPAWAKGAVEALESLLAENEVLKREQEAFEFNRQQEKTALQKGLAVLADYERALKAADVLKEHLHGAAYTVKIANEREAKVLIFGYKDWEKAVDAYAVERWKLPK